MTTINVRLTLPWLLWLAWFVTAVTFLILKWNGSVTWHWATVLSPLWGIGAVVTLMAFYVILLMVVE